MPPALFPTLRYVHTWIRGADDLVSDEITLDREGVPVPATVTLPRRRKEPLPAWIVLHGITRPGRAHAQLVRFTRALASTGGVVLVPEVPEWRALHLAPRLTAPTVRAAIAGLRELPAVRDAPLALVGFSFGAPQAIVASAAPEIRDELAGVVGFGGYCDLERTIRFQITGRHEWDGQRHRLRPDPYGRWIVAANYLTHIPEHRDAGDVADALRTLAALAGDAGVPSWDPRFDPDKDRLEEEIAPGRRALFRLFAPPSTREPDTDEGEAMASALAAAARTAEPRIEPARYVGEVRGPVHILHGRHDHLIPFTEACRLRESLPSGVTHRLTVTRLFGHSAQDPLPGLLEGVREGWAFLEALRRMVALV